MGATQESGTGITELCESLKESERRLAELSAAVAEHRAQWTELASRLARREGQIADLMAERMAFGSRLGRLLSRVRARSFPVTTRRGRLLSTCQRLALSLHRSGSRGVACAILARGRSSWILGDLCVAVFKAIFATDFDHWIDTHEPDEGSLREQRILAGQLERKTLFSVIIPTYQVSGRILEALLRSLQAQTYTHWEACIAYADVGNDENWELLQRYAERDSRLRLLRLDENLGISGNSNAALAMARGDFVALLDHDDELTPWALYEMARHIEADPEVDFFYSDKDCIDASGITRMNPLFKPKWSPEMLYSVNYLTHFNVMRRSIVEAAGGWRSETDGAQDWDLFYRVSECAAKIERVAGIHYHWRIISSSTASGIAAKPYAALAQLRAQEGRLQRLGLPASAVPHDESGFRILWRGERAPCVDLVLRSRGGRAADEGVLRGLRGAGAGLLASVRLVGPGSGVRAISPEGFAGMAAEVLPFGSSEEETEAMVEAGERGTAPVVAFVDLCVAELSSDWLEELTGWVRSHPEIAFAGALVVTRESEVVEAGRIVDGSGRSLPLFRGAPMDHSGPFGGPLWFRNVSAVAPFAVACKRREWARAASGSAGSAWVDAFVAQCTRMRQSGGRGLMTPHARAYLDRVPEEALPVWNESFSQDPYFHPAFESVCPLRLRSSARADPGVSGRPEG